LTGARKHEGPEHLVRVWIEQKPDYRFTVLHLYVEKPCATG
jgi:hypothetical protein